MCGSMNGAISVEEAICRVLQETHVLEALTYNLGDEQLLGCLLAETVVATTNIPVRPTSIMDGYAVVGPLAPGTYTVSGSVLAGDNPPDSAAGVYYITTGGQLPPGTNAVVKVEDTESFEESGEKFVKISADTPVGQNVRQIGSDVAVGQELLKAGDIIGPIELGLLASVGRVAVRCYRKPVIGVMSTGSELVNAWEPCEPWQVRDSNRIALLAAFRDLGARAVDLGIVKDCKETLRAALQASAQTCDVVVSSGGVSMGSADFVKPILSEIGSIHFSKLNMKPGKPTTFATFRAGERRALFFGLPGNPVSCLVTSALFVQPALRRLQGLPAHRTLHPQVSVQFTGADIDLDPERPEYHRAELVSHGRELLARSTGNQRSSRLLSMRSANALLVLPQGPGVVKAGTRMTALLVGPLAAPVPTSLALLAHPNAASVDGLDFLQPPQPKMLPSAAASAAADWTTIRVGVLTISDRAYSGVYPDESGPTMTRLLDEMTQSADYPLRFVVANAAIVPDEPAAIAQFVRAWSEPGAPECVDVILTSGGTGFGARDHTPEALRPELHREAPGVAQALLAEGLKFTPLAVMSRPVAGTRYQTFVATLPGSVKAVKENLGALKPLLPRICELLKTDDCTPRFNK